MEVRLAGRRVPLPTRVDDLPDLPSAYATALEPALDALARWLGHSALDGAGRGAVDGHVRLLLAWNAAINLTAITDPAAVARLHVIDSLAVLPILLAGPHATLVDLGSGGGFPGLALAAALPATEVLLVDSVAKKTAFLEVAARAVGLAGRVVVANRRAETLPRDRWDVVTARAVGGLPELVELALPLLRRGGRLIAWKRGPLEEEMAAAGRAAAALGGSEPRFLAVRPDLAEAAGIAGHGFAVVEKVASTPHAYPRDPAARKRAPW
jgi:16S rRNA (guanine527-N7)-methyltransferase